MEPLSDALSVLFQQRVEALGRLLEECADRGERPGVALGGFELIHAGTIRDLRQARSRCDRLFVAILPQHRPIEDADVARLLRWDERLRVLEALQEVDACAVLCDDPLPVVAQWAKAAPDALWFTLAADGFFDPTFGGATGIAATPVGENAGCTTESLLRRMRGPSAR